VAALPAMVINRNFPRAVAHGPRSHQGLNLPNLFTKQLIAHVMTILWFGPQQDDPTGHLLKANVEAFRLEVGLCGQVFQMPTVLQDYMTPTWFMQTWINCRLLDIDITADIADYVRPRKQDREIMRVLIKHGLTGNELAAMNNELVSDVLTCNFLSHICTSNGTAMKLHHWAGQNICESPFSWPKKEKPLIQDWNQWKSHLTSALSLQRHNGLPVPLGTWSKTVWERAGFFIEPEGNHLIEYQQQQWYIFSKIPTRQHKLQFHKDP